MQQQNTPITQLSFGEDDSSCDSHTRWGMYEWGVVVDKKKEIVPKKEEKMKTKKQTGVLLAATAAVVDLCINVHPIYQIGILV